MKPLHELKSLVDLFYKAKSTELESKLIHFKNNWAVIKNSKFKLQKFFNFEINCALDITELKNVVNFYKERCSIVEIEENELKYLQFNFENGISFKVRKYETCDEMFSSSTYEAGFQFPKESENVFQHFRNFNLKYFVFSKELLALTDRHMLVGVQSGLNFPFEILTESNFYLIASIIKEKPTLLGLEGMKVRLFFEKCFLEFNIETCEDIVYDKIKKLVYVPQENYIEFEEKLPLIKQCLKGDKIVFTNKTISSDNTFVKFEGIEGEYCVDTKYAKQIVKYFKRLSFANNIVFFENGNVRGAVACFNK